MKVSDEDLATLAVWNGLPKGAVRCAPIVDRLVDELRELRAVADEARLRCDEWAADGDANLSKLDAALKAAGR